MVRLARPAPAPRAPLPCRCRCAQAMVQVEEEASPLAAHCAWHLSKARFMSPLACAAMALLLLLLRGAVAGGVRVSRTALELALGLALENASPCMRAAAQSIVHCCCVPDASYSPLNTKPLGSHSPWHSTRMASASASLSELTNRGGAEVGPARRPGTTGSGRLQVPLCAGHGAGLRVVTAGAALGVTLKQHGLRRLAVAMQPQHATLMLRRTTRSHRRGARAHGRSLPPQRARRPRPRLRLHLRLRRAAGRRAALLACEGLCLGQRR